MNLYAYVHNDPLTHFDEYGLLDCGQMDFTPQNRRQSVFNPIIIVAGGLQILGGFSEASAGVSIGMAGLPVILHGLDNIATGFTQVYTNQPCETLTFKLLRKANLSPNAASWAEWGLAMGCSYSSKESFSFLGKLFGNPIEKQLLSFEPKAIQQYLNAWSRSSGGIGGRITSDYRKNLIRYTGFDPGKAAEAHHVLPQVHREQFLKAGINIDDPKYLAWVEKKLHRAISKGYNKDWKEFFQKNNNPDRNQILQMGKQTMFEIGIPPNY